MKTEKPLTLGSLFDGSGGFPLSGVLNGIEPVWAAEVEPYPIAVTRSRFPHMKHYGDVSKMCGAELEPVDIVTFGSPCQDMSIAGKREGLKHEAQGDEETTRSGLFYEAIRIIKEMREATNGEYPKYAVWENVPGAFSSNKGHDFHAVLEALCSVCDDAVSIPEPYDTKRTKLVWNKAGEIVGDNYSVAWRTLDAQYWGVPQRRRRIYLVADFAGRSAGKVLFESEGVSGYSAEGFSAWQRAACRAEGGAGAASVCLNDQGGARMDVSDDVPAALRTEARHPPCVMESAGFCTELSAKARSIGYEEETSPTLRAGVVRAAIALESHPIDSRIKIESGDSIQTLTRRMGTGGMKVPLLMSEETPLTLKIRSGCEGGGKGPLIQDDKSAILGCNNDQTHFEPKSWDGSDVSPTRTANNAGGNQRMPDKQNFNCVLQAFGICSDKSNSMLSNNPHSGIYEATTARTIDGNGGNPGCNQGGVAIVEPIPFTQNQRDEVRTLDGKSGAVQAQPGMKQQTFVLQGSMIGREDKNGTQCDGVNEDVSFTLNTIDRHAVYAMTTGGFTQVAEESASTLLSRDYKDAPDVTEPSYGIGRDAFNQGRNALYKPAIEEELQPTLTSRGPGAAMTRYTIRRLTPTEYARLQGFPDDWGHLAPYNPADAEFWEIVRKTHAEINGKVYKPVKNLKAWYEKLHNDGAEYKMWGNGIALPCAEYVLRGIAEEDEMVQRYENGIEFEEEK